MTTDLLLYVGKSSACLLAFYLLYYFLLRNENCFRYNRWYLLGSVAASFLLPWVKLPAVAAAVSYSKAVAQLNPMYYTLATETTSVASAGALSWQQVAWGLYLAGFCFFCYRFARQLYSLYQLVKTHAGNAQAFNGIAFIPIPGAYPTFSFFQFIFFDTSGQLNPEEKHRILLHEQAHVRQKHSYDVVLLELLQVLFWFNPLLLLYRKALVATHEFLADAQVIQSEDITTYGLQLATQALHNSHFSLGHYFNKSLTLTRLKMIQQTNHRTARVKQFLALPLLALLVVSLSSNTPSITGTSGVSKGDPSKQLAVSQEPMFPGGAGAFMRAFYPAPAEATQKNEYGSVILQVTIKEDGRMADYKVLQASHSSLEKFVLGAFQKMPNWEPAKAGNTPIATTHVFPINFIVDGFGNDRQAIKKQNEEALARVLSTTKSQSLTFHAPTNFVTYGPEK